MASQLAPTPAFVVERPVVQQSITGRVTQAMRYWLLFGWTQGVACTASSAAITGNTTATTGSFVVMARADEATALTYATTYASSGGTAMVYRIDVVVEQVL